VHNSRLSITSIAADFGIELKPVIHNDSSAVIGIAYRRGLGGKSRHVRVQYLWIQSAINEKEIDINKVNTLGNLADVLTKFLNVESFNKHV
jgi:hypothetical protein